MVLLYTQRCPQHPAYTGDGRNYLSRQHAAAVIQVPFRRSLPSLQNVCKGRVFMDASRDCIYLRALRYEPWGLVSRLLTPWFDARLRGYGRNKIMYSAALNSSGFAFNIDPDAFVIHRPHTKSTAQRIFDDENDRRCCPDVAVLLRGVAATCWCAEQWCTLQPQKNNCDEGRLRL